MSEPGPARPARVAGALALILLSLAALARLAASAPRSKSGHALALVAGVLFAALVHSVWEWTFHRYVYHRVLAEALRRIQLTHHRDHHLVHFPAWRFTSQSVEDGSVQAHPSVWEQVFSRVAGRSIALPDRWVYLSAGAGAVGWAGFLLTRNIAFCAGIAAAGVAIFHLFGKVHGTIHRPGTHPRIEAQPWFRFLERHHFVHHVDSEANENFLLPLADWLFGTLRLSVTPQELAALAVKRREEGRARG
jgi:hypothetical protein